MTAEAAAALPVGFRRFMIVAATTLGTAAYDFTWTGSHHWNQDLQVDAHIDFIGAQAITTDSGNLLLMPGGDVELDPQDDDVLPGGSYRVDLGDFNRKFRTLHVAELVAETLVAQEVMATVGGRILVTPSNTLIADVAPEDTTIDVKVNNWQQGDWVRFEGFGAGGLPQFEIMQMLSAPTQIAGGWRYSVRRKAF